MTVNEIELSYDEYRALIWQEIYRVVAEIVDGNQWSGNDVNLLRNLNQEVMYPPLDWIERMPQGIQAQISQIQADNESSLIASYYFEFESRQAGGELGRGSLFMTYGWIKTK